jgi:CHAT domain-containing protein
MQQLYDGLVRPVADKLADCERLIVIPFGATHAVPFHALHDGEQYLLEKHEVTVCPSSSLLRLCAERTPPAGGRCIAVAYSDGGRLPWAVDEARSVAGLMGGEWYAEERATRETVMNIASRQRIVHFATHATARLDNPSFGHLMLADGQLSMSDVCNLDLEGALVTLSACETGRASVVGGDELVGLSRGFLYAGAATLVQSLWRVEDESTANLMRRFYTQLCAGRPAASALRVAQRSLLEDGNDVFKWAPFQLVGSSGEKIIGGSA